MSHYISFPALGWTFHVSPTIVEFTLFGHEFSLNWYGLLIALGFLLAVIYALKRAQQFDIDPDRMIDVVLVAAIFAFIGARLYYVLFCDDRAQYFENPIRILYVWEGGLGIYGGIIFAFIAGLIMCRVRKVNAPASVAVFAAAALGDLFTYVVTSVQLGVINGGMVKFITIFAVTQIPLAIAEGLLTVVIFNVLEKYSKTELHELQVL